MSAASVIHLLLHALVPAALAWLCWRKQWRVALAVMLGFVAIAFGRNWSAFVEHFHLFFYLVVGHNALALLVGFAAARLTGLNPAQQRAITLEVGIQNAALGLAIIFTFFPQATGMLLIAAFWGTWHLVSGLLLALYWSRQPLPALSEAKPCA